MDNRTNYNNDYEWRNVVLEISLKPFVDITDEGIQKVAEKLFLQWIGLWRHSERISVLFWTADGSEMLEYAGDHTRPIEWARYVGGANPPEGAVPDDPEKISLFGQSKLYCPHPPEITYDDLRRIVKIVRETAGRMTGLPIDIGTTFDPGPEFSQSRFKYEWHREICRGGADLLGDKNFVSSATCLNGDSRKYAGFPSGIPDGTPLGQFLGRQCRFFCEAMGFDYIWFSNGFGFGEEPWRMQGALFNEQVFDASAAEACHCDVVKFWEMFRQECPDLPVQVRGTNLTVGVDMSTDAVSYQDLYSRRFNFTTPPNSPWAAIDGDFGLELAGYMTRIAELPADQDGFPFRFYTNDPWWSNSPWLDRYERSPHDIYLPMSVARITEKGRMQTADVAEFLTVNDSFGNMPDQIPDEVIPHIREGARHRPDRPGPVVWIYPLQEYHEMTFGGQPDLPRVFAGDWLVRAAINQGVPLNTVVSSRIFKKTVESTPDLYRGTVLLSIVPPADSGLEKALLDVVDAGGRVLLYGSMQGASDRLKARLNLTLTEPLDGEFEVFLSDTPDHCIKSLPSGIQHRSLLCGGGCTEILSNADDGEISVLARYCKGSEERIAALFRPGTQNGGGLAWVRGTNSMQGDAPKNLPKLDDPSQWLDGALLLKLALFKFGWQAVAQKSHAGQRSPLYTVARHKNGFWFSGFVPDTNVGLALRIPVGAPLLNRWETELHEGRSVYRFPKAWREECRVFIDGQTQGSVGCHEWVRRAHGVQRRIILNGLDHAVIRFFPETGTEESVRFLANPNGRFHNGDWRPAKRCESDFGLFFEVEGCCGDLTISW